jgi:hypothetical protein
LTMWRISSTLAEFFGIPLSLFQSLNNYRYLTPDPKFPSDAVPHSGCAYEEYRSNRSALSNDYSIPEQLGCTATPTASMFARCIIVPEPRYCVHQFIEGEVPILDRPPHTADHCELARSNERR